MNDAGKSSSASGRADVAIESVLGVQHSTVGQRLIASQAFWVAMAILIICIVMSITEVPFRSEDNFFNITRNFALTGCIALGMTAVIITGGIDLSVGSIVGVVAVASGLVLETDAPWYVAMAVGLGAGAAVGAVNGWLIAYIGLPPFVVTLGMLSAARSVAVIMSGNKMLYKFGAGAPIFKSFGAGSMLGIANPVWIMVGMTLLFAAVLRWTAWGRHLYAIGGNEQAAILTGVAVRRVKFEAYVVCALTSAVSGILTLGWAGSAINAMGTGYELRAIASAVIGGANLMGGEGGSLGAFVGSALIEIIRNSLLMAGVDSNWQGLFVGLFIVAAVLLERVRGRKRE
jgi:ribose transport system permease protein